MELTVKNVQAYNKNKSLFINFGKWLERLGKNNTDMEYEEFLKCYDYENECITYKVDKTKNYLNIMFNINAECDIEEFCEQVDNIPNSPMKDFCILLDKLEDDDYLVVNELIVTKKLLLEHIDDCDTTFIEECDVNYIEYENCFMVTDKIDRVFKIRDI